MKILGVQPRDLYFNVDISMMHMIYLIKILSMAEINFDGNNDVLAKNAVEYLNKELYPMLMQVKEKFKEEFLQEETDINTGEQNGINFK